MKLEVGKRYKARDGSEEGPMIATAVPDYPFKSTSSGLYYSELGDYFWGSDGAHPHPRDLECVIDDAVSTNELELYATTPGQGIAIPIEGDPDLISISGSGLFKTELKGLDGKLVHIGFGDHSTDIIHMFGANFKGILSVLNRDQQPFDVYVRVRKAA